MLPPNIGAWLVHRYDNSPLEPLVWLRHQGWILLDGTLTDLGYAEVEMPRPYFFGPTPPNAPVSVRPEGDLLQDYMFLWTLVELSKGVEGGPPAGRSPDRVRRENTGEVYQVERLLDVAATQSGLRGAWLQLAR